jgi:hypothetical protein
MQIKRVGDRSLRGKSLSALGTLLRPSDRAAEVVLNEKGFEVSRALLASTAWKVRLINVVPSLVRDLLQRSFCDA